MPTEKTMFTLAEVVRRAADVIDPQAQDPEVGEFAQRFEDADEPITAIADIEQLMAEETGRLDPQDESPPLVMAEALVVYLAHRRDEMERDGLTLLREATRAEFDGKPPEHVAAWLREAGVEW